jgi:hypothetical protein
MVYKINRHFLNALFLLAALLLTSAAGMADSEANAAPPTADPIPLETQLAATLPAWTRQGRLLLYVQRNVDQDSLVPSSQPPVDPSTIDLGTPQGVAAANDHTSVWFGSVLAIAPAEMTILNTAPALYDIPASEIAKAKPIEFLLKSLTTEQFGLLATAGLGITDLNLQQVPLFTAVIPDPLGLVSSDASVADDESYTKQILSVPREQILQQIRLHFYIAENTSIQCGDQTIEPAGKLGNNDERAQNNYSTGPMKYAESIVFDQFEGSQEWKQLESRLIQQVPTVLKKSDIIWKDHALIQRVNVNGVNTVEDLVKRLSKALKIELYADASYGKCKITLGGDMRTPVSAADLMNALAFSANGAWRHVGPCYILTDDIVGLGQREEGVRDIISAWSNQLQSDGSSAARKLAAFNWVSTLSVFPTDQDLFPTDQLMSILDGGTKQASIIKFSELPAGIQAEFAKQIEKENQKPEAPDDNSVEQRSKIVVTPNTSVNFYVNIVTAFELPGDGIMNYGLIEGKLIPPINDNSKITQSEKCQAAICAPKSTKEAIQTVDKLAKMGLNTLILDVFCNGKTYFDNSAFPPKSKDAANVLSAAIAEAAKKHVTVYAAVDLLCWRKDYAQSCKAPWPFPVSEDVDVGGKPSEVDGIERLNKGVLDNEFSGHPGYEGKVNDQINDAWVNPLDPAVRAMLSSLMADLAKVRGISGIIMLDTAAPGYGTDPLVDPRPPLGFSPVNRLKLIREKHIDPIDLDTAATTSLHTNDDAWFENLTSIWCKIPGFERPRHGPLQPYLMKGDLETLKQCAESAKKSNPSVSILTEDTAGDMTISPWSDIKPPTDPDYSSDGTPKCSFISIPILLMGTNDSSVAQDVKDFETDRSSMSSDEDDNLGEAKPDGIAYNLVDGGVDENVPKMLDWLATYLTVKRD